MKQVNDEIKAYSKDNSGNYLEHRMLSGRNGRPTHVQVTWKVAEPKPEQWKEEWNESWT